MWEKNGKCVTVLKGTQGKVVYADDVICNNTGIGVCISADCIKSSWELIYNNARTISYSDLYQFTSVFKMVAVVQMC